ncbi:MAG: cytochrome c1 [Erythrobacter sp.]|uniref:cytochrome c1 n=1 Tax=Erythrobacter sp. TaxID=1042 RepID=UPI002617ADC1|nr:cytochrome c1 [Erythrobacter sp.]MDJ0979564.1 cytochrome c1 [Erythrobacter sp.]
MTIRLGGIIFGLVLVGVLLAWSFIPDTVKYSAPTKSPYYAFHEEKLKPAGGFSFDGLGGKWDYQQLQRGYQVYKEVCSACHGMKYVAFRNLEQLGYTEAEVRAEAASWSVPGLDPVTGESTMRPAEPTDYFPSPYPNEIAARAANNNALPPDLSLITKARPDGANYVYSLMQGYVEPTEEDLAKAKELAGGVEWETPVGLYFNEHFYNANIAMPPQLYPDLITYADGTEATVEQMAQDVSAFLTWTAEPSLVARKQTGWFVIGFLLFATGLAFLSYKQIWAEKKKKKA